MPYSMVGSSTLGYDLVRLPHGEQVAAVVRATLRCTPADLAALARHHPGARRLAWTRLLEDGEGPGTMTAALPLADAAFARAIGGDGAGSAALLSRLESAMMGSVRALDRMLRHELLGWTWVRSGDLAVQDPDAASAADVLLDAAASAYTSASTHSPLRRDMASAYVASRVGTTDEPGTGHDGVDALLDTVACADSRTRAAWRDTVDLLRPGTTGWAPAMHQATWAVSLTDRLPLATHAQMAAVSAFRSAGFEPRDAAYGVWNALSGAVQATVAADLLATADRDRLLAVWSAVHG